MNQDIVIRFSGNPILTKADIPYPVETVHNAAVTRELPPNWPPESGRGGQPGMKTICKRTPESTV